MKKTIFFASLILIALASGSCSDNDGDTTPPVINLISPAEGARLQIGDPDGIHLEMQLSDNETLRSYKVDIHDNSDGHGHSRAETGAPAAFNFSKTWDVAGLRNTTVNHHEIVIPAGVRPGPYHMVVYCTDEAGNQTYVARNITLGEDGSGDHEDE